MLIIHTYLDIVNTHNAPTVIHILLQVFFLREERKKQKQERKMCIRILIFCKDMHTMYSIVQTLTRYSNTSVRHLSVWIMSWRVTILACFKSFSRDTRRGKRIRQCQASIGNLLEKLKRLITLGVTRNCRLSVTQKSQKLLDNMVLCWCVRSLYFQIT